MKGMKKLLSILMVLTLVLSLGATAFAATVSIGEAKDGVSHTYKAYQIFSGTQADTPDDAELGDIAWGTGIKADAFANALVDGGYISGVTADGEGHYSAKDVAKALSAIPEGDAKLVEIAKIAAANINGDGEVLKSGTENTLDDGYYVILDTTEVDDQNAVKNQVILQLTENVDVQFKTDIPSPEKKVKDVNDSTDGVETGWQDSADWDIGDRVPFQLSAKIPANTAVGYKEYEIIYHDEQSNGLTFDGADNVEVYLNESRIPIDKSLYSVVTDNLGDDCAFHIVIPDILKVDGFDATNANTLYVEYTSTLNNNAVIGSKGNPNKLYLEFSNDSMTDGTGTTPEDKVIVFTYDTDVNKVDEEGHDLTGAEFALYKVVKEGTDGAEAVSGIDQLKEVKELEGKFVKKLTITKQADGHNFYSKGIDDGEYWLVETKAPDGYNTLPPQKLVVEAGHDVLSANPGLTKLSDTQGIITFDHTKSNENGNAENAIGEGKIENQKGITLPETGGIGTTIFYIAGAILVAGAVILLVTKKRVSGMEK